jgi:hypothetical protein
MLDMFTGNPYKVATHDPLLPYLVIRASQLDAVTRLLDRVEAVYEVDVRRYSFNGEPEVLYIYFKRGTDPRPIQEALDHSE